MTRLASLYVRYIPLGVVFVFGIYGALLRYWNLSIQPYWMDEGYTILAIRTLIERGTLVLDSGFLYHCFTYCYPTAAIAHVWGASALTYRLIAVLAGIACIFIIFHVTRHLFDVRAALLTSFFITFSYWHIAWSRQARWYTLFTACVWVAVYFFHRFLSEQEHKKRHLFFATLSTALAMATHGLGYILPMIFACWFTVNALKKQSFRLRHSITVLGIGIATLAFLEHTMHFLSHITLHYTLPYYLNFYIREYWFLILLGLIGVMSTYTQYRHTYHILGILCVPYIVAVAFFSDIVHYRYLFHLTPVFCMLGAVGVCALADTLKHRIGTILVYALVVVCFGIWGGVYLPATTYYLESDTINPHQARPYYSYTPQPNWNGAYAHIATHTTPDSIIISSHPHFTKIFLDTAGYWLAHSYLGYDTYDSHTVQGRELYVDAMIIDSVAELDAITKMKTGFLVFDYMVTDGRYSEETLAYIQDHFKLVFHEKTNDVSEIWVYAF
ncbi:MAG: glycosyltransferase family 39 protein [Candidatus Pacebacteria bacterium]|nr:glycosyltransferase family 39 protein [Candidatus Paceibacterota bacterium]